MAVPLVTAIVFEPEPEPEGSVGPKMSGSEPYTFGEAGSRNRKRTKVEQLGFDNESDVAILGKQQHIVLIGELSSVVNVIPGQDDVGNSRRGIFENSKESN